MLWTLVHSSLTNVYHNQDNEIVITGALTGKYLVISCETIGNPGWKFAGHLRSEWDDSNIGRVQDRWWRCYFGQTSIKLNDWQFLNPLVFRPKPYLVNIQLKIWSTPDMAIYDPIARIEEDLKNLNEI